MNRRTVLAGVGLSLAAAAGWYASIGGRESTPDEERTPRVRGTEPTVRPGRETAVVVEATDVTRVTVRDLSTDTVEFHFGDAAVSPPASIFPMSPPMWIWDARADVRLRIPITVADDATPGRYQYRVRVFDDPLEERVDSVDGFEEGELSEDATDERDATDEAFAITVVRW